MKSSTSKTKTRIIKLFSWPFINWKAKKCLQVYQLYQEHDQRDCSKLKVL